MSELKARRAFLHAITPLHPGTGQSVDVVDLPVAREKATGWPVVPGSSVKGTLRSECADKPTKERLFGKEDSGGPISFTDMRLLCLPVRSYFGTFAWVTSPLALRRFERDDVALGAKEQLWALDKGAGIAVTDEACLLPAAASQSGAVAGAAPNSALVRKGRVCFEDLNFTGTASAVAATVGEALSDVTGIDRDTFVKRFAIVSDMAFDFLCETGTEVAARIALGEDGTTSGKGGNLWYEEAVPAESIFCGWAIESGASRDALPDAWKIVEAAKTIQIGGNATVGRGICRLVVKA